MDFQEAKETYFRYLQRYIFHASTSPFWTDLPYLQTSQRIVMADTAITNPEIINYWQNFKDEFEKRYVELDGNEKANLYKVLKDEFYPEIDKYMLFFKDEMEHVYIYHGWERDLGYLRCNPPMGSNPYTVLWFLCTETKVLLEKLTVLTENEKALLKANIRATLAGKIIEGIGGIFKSYIGIYFGWHLYQWMCM